MFVLLAASDAASPWWWDALGLLSIPALIALNGFFVAAEFALVKIRRTRVEELIQQGVHGAKAVDKATSHLDRYIASTQLGITLASLALGWFGETALEHVIRPLFSQLPPPFHYLASHSVAGTTAFLCITFMHVVMGELVPKTIALQTTERTSLLVSAPLIVFTKLTRPMIILMNGTGNLVLRLIGYKVPISEAEGVHSVEELALIIEDVEEAGKIDPEQADLVQNVFALTSKTVRDCMIPKDRMVALELHTSPEDILAVVRQSAHTRMPVYENDINNIVGIVNTKDLFHVFSLHGLVILEDAMYPPMFFRPDEPAANALRQFKKVHRPMALVRDGEKILGLVTLEDVLEEIVGEIEDEHDLPRFKTVLWRKRQSANGSETAKESKRYSHKTRDGREAAEKSEGKKP